MTMKRASSSGAATTSHFMLAVYNVVICCANFRQVCSVSRVEAWAGRSAIRLRKLLVVGSLYYLSTVGQSCDS
jgi:hypothetical protein